ncbi:hypothetical protein F5883DRAFT_646829 [Diaporthe sp. PMI_573]|nr:hypothetical protein F5883DRAFT_646829 [Diaporthaceae sp. PMI_573]
MATLRTSQVFSRLHQRVNVIFIRYISYANSSLAANFAAEIYVVYLGFTRSLSENPESKGLKGELFDEVVARVMQQKAAEALSASYQQNLLVQLCLHLFVSPENPTGTLNVQTLVFEIGSRLVNLGTQLLEFIQDGDTTSADIDPTLASFTNLGCFMSAIASDGAQRPACPLEEHNLWSLGRVGVDLVLGIIRADSYFDISMDLIRLKVFKVVTTWFNENREFLSEEICEEQDLYLCQYRLFSFYDWLEITEGEEEYPPLAHNANMAALGILRNLENRFGHQTLLEVLEEYPDGWANWIMDSLEDLD